MKKRNNKTDTKLGRSPHRNKYAYDLKRRVVNDILRGIISKEEAMLKYGIRSRQSINYWISQYSFLNYREQKDYGMKESLEEKAKRLELENEALKEDKMILNTLIDVVDEQYKTNIRKKLLPQQLKGYKKHKNSGKGKK